MNRRKVIGLLGGARMSCRQNRNLTASHRKKRIGLDDKPAGLTS
jgi:hypothetical protein